MQNQKEQTILNASESAQQFRLEVLLSLGDLPEHWPYRWHTGDQSMEESGRASSRSGCRLLVET
jgi:hypothetical protein